jgi:hypothetical protein
LDWRRRRAKFADWENSLRHSRESLSSLIDRFEALYAARNGKKCIHVAVHGDGRDHGSIACEELDAAHPIGGDAVEAK